ncbi:isochorismatase family protein [Saccharopolyspora sp. NPDC050389]|uniref:isochorismatase family protein n=1 Tax=Saccharopolyspora sp. NPDC050389 TaxID=3155516 RepID=UPI003405C607
MNNADSAGCAPAAHLTEGAPATTRRGCAPKRPLRHAACRPDLIVAGVTNDVCTAYPTLTAIDEGYRVQVVADAGGSTSKLADEVALRRWSSPEPESPRPT